MNVMKNLMTMCALASAVCLVSCSSDDEMNVNNDGQVRFTAAIGNEVFITYIGLGLPLEIPSLGNLLNEGRLLMTAPPLRYQLIFPTVVLAVITISFYIIGNAFADAADPKNHV